MTSMRRTRLSSPLNSTGSPSRRRRCDLLLLKNMWLLPLLRRVIFPVPVILKRFAADLWVLIFGMFPSKRHDVPLARLRILPQNEMGPSISHRELDGPVFQIRLLTE